MVDLLLRAGANINAPVGDAQTVFADCGLMAYLYYATSFIGSDYENEDLPFEGDFPAARRIIRFLYRRGAQLTSGPNSPPDSLLTLIDANEYNHPYQQDWRDLVNSLRRRAGERL